MTETTSSRCCEGGGGRDSFSIQVPPLVAEGWGPDAKNSTGKDPGKNLPGRKRTHSLAEAKIGNGLGMSERQDTGPLWSGEERGAASKP